MSVQENLNKTHRGYGFSKEHHTGDRFLHRHHEMECRFHLNHADQSKSHVIVDLNDWTEAKRIYNKTRTFWQRLKFLFIG